MVDLDGFLSYAAQGYTRVPLWQTLHLPGIAPLAVYRALANRGDDYLFETRRHLSASDGSFAPQLSVVGLKCAERIELDGQRLCRRYQGALLEETFDADPLALLQRQLAAYRVPHCEGLPEFSGGHFGYFGFETARMIEPRLNLSPRKPMPFDVPDIVQLVSEELIVFDHVSGKVSVIVHARADGADRIAGTRQYAAASDRLAALCCELRNLDPEPAVRPSKEVHATYDGLTYTFPRPAFEAAVAKIGEYIRAGDVMQVVLSQRMTRPLASNAIDYYCALTALSSSPYSYLLNLGDSQIVGVSPEMLVQQRAGRIVSRPMAGTRRRGADLTEDQRLEAELRADPKEIAEHMMLVDLARNDLGRFAELGSVEVAAKLTVERYSHVMHFVSTVLGRAPADCHGLRAMRCTLPAGTLSGAPKIRALEVISELEPFSRGIYGGAIGYLTWQGDTDLAITIRTAVLHDGQLHLQVGAGIVSDSRPEREWQETIEKSHALMLAAAQAESLTAGRFADGFTVPPSAPASPQTKTIDPAKESLTCIS